MSETKICTVCGKELPATREFFYYEKRVVNGFKAKCIICFKEEGKKYKEKNYSLEKVRQYINANRDHYEEYWKKYKEKNKTKITKQKQEYYNTHKQHIKNKVKQYQTENKEKILLKNIIYKRTRYIDSTEHYTLNEWNKCKEHFDNCCAYCGEHAKRLEKEHFVAFIRGGEYSRFNIIPVCKSCNCSKHDKDFFEWYPQQRFYSKQRENKILKYLNYNKNRIQQLSIL